MPGAADGGPRDEQLERVWANLRAILAALGGRTVPTTTIVVGTLSDDWLIELEIVAAA